MVLSLNSDVNDLCEIVFSLGYLYQKMSEEHNGEVFIGLASKG